MATDERILRLENAMATLAEISAQHNERLTMMERSVQMMERSVQMMERSAQMLVELTAGQVELTANQQRRVARLEESFVTLVELLQNHKELDSPSYGCAGDGTSSKHRWCVHRQ